jgi:hypothetical protein
MTRGGILIRLSGNRTGEDHKCGGSKCRADSGALHRHVFLLVTTGCHFAGVQKNSRTPATTVDCEGFSPSRRFSPVAPPLKLSKE